MNSIFQLEQSNKGDFMSAKTAYEGTDSSTFISGLAGGTYFFRVRSLGDNDKPLPWSDIIQVNVKYVSPRVVTILLIVGVVVLVTTVTAVIKGHNRHNA